MTGNLPNAFKLHKTRLLDSNYSFLQITAGEIPQTTFFVQVISKETAKIHSKECQH